MELGTINGDVGNDAENDDTNPLISNSVSDGQKKEDPNGIDIDSTLLAASSKHEEILRETRQFFFKILYIVLSFALTYSMRTNIFILYARTFYNDTAVISVIVYLSYCMSAISSLLFGIIGDRWRFDYLLIIAAIFDVITFFVEATTTYFVVLAIAYAIGGQPFQAIGQSWKIKCLPTYYAQQFKTQLLSLYTLGYIVGPILGGKFF